MIDVRLRDRIIRRSYVFVPTITHRKNVSSPVRMISDAKYFDFLAVFYALMLEQGSPTKDHRCKLQTIAIS